MLLSISRLTTVFVCSFVCLLVVGEVSAWANEGYAASGSIASPPGGFEYPLGVAVNQSTGNVYVSDFGKGTVDVYNTSHEYLSQVTVPGGNPYELAVDNSGGSSEGDVYVAGSASNVVYKYDATANGSLIPDPSTPEIGGGGVLNRPTAVAVGAGGDVYVASSTGMVAEFSSSGEVLNPDLITGLFEPQGIALNSAGDIYVATENQGTVEYGPLGECVEACTPINVGPKNRDVVVASQGDVLVADEATGKVAEYGPDPSHALIQEFGAFQLPFGIATDPIRHIAYVADLFGKVVDTFEEGPTPEAPETGTAEVKGATAILHGTLNPNASAKAGWYFAYNTNGGCTGGGTTPVEAEVEGQGLAESVEASGLEPATTYTYCMVARNKYGSEYGAAESFTTGSTQPVVEGGSVSNVVISGATLEAQVNPEKQETTCLRFEYGETSAYGNSVPCSEASLGSGYGGVQATAVVSNLKPNTAYHFRVVVENPSSPPGGTFGPDETFQTSPLIAGESFSEAGQHGTTISAQLNTGGLATSYYVEYGSTSAYGSSTPVQVTEEGEGTVSASARIEALESYSEYHFRVVASNSDGAEERGEDLAFRTLPAPINGLPDERVYEMVDPANDSNANVYVPYTYAETATYEKSNAVETQWPFQVAVNGSAIAYVGDPNSEGHDGHSFRYAGVQYLATRSSSGAWDQKVIAPSYKSTYAGFQSDLAAGVLISRANEEAEMPLSARAPKGGYFMLYACVFNFGPCTTSEEEGSGAIGSPYQSLVTVKPPNRSASEFGGQGDNDESSSLATFAGGSADFGDLLFEANDALIPGEGAVERELGEDVKREVAAGEDNLYLYDSVAAKLALIDVLPGTPTVPAGEVAPDAVFGASPFRSDQHANGPDFSGVISADGSRVYWTDQAAGADEDRIFLRENPGQPVSPVDPQGHCLVADDACTVQVSTGAARYWTSVEDGRFAFYTEDGALYRFNAVTGVSEALTKTSAGVMGVVGSSETGEDVYVVAEEALTATPNNEGAAPQQGEANLYLLANGTPVFVATLEPSDGNEVEPFKGAIGAGVLSREVGDWQPSLGHRTAEVTPSGGGVVFMSGAHLKAVGFPNGVPSGGVNEVYLFRASSDQLFCVSCSPSGETPPASVGHGGFGAPSAAFVPISWTETYEPTWVSADGDQVFFDSEVPLVPQDTNGAQDVYEWEREGSGSCVAGSGANGGCLYLLSSGSSTEDSFLVGSSASGEDVFMVTRSKLVPEDGDEAYNLFDVRVGGVRPVEETACTGTGCQGVPAAPPTFATPPSVTFDGVGNFAPSNISAGPSQAKRKTATRCPKNKVRKGGKCVKAKSKGKKRSLPASGHVKRHRRAA